MNPKKVLSPKSAPIIQASSDHSEIMIDISGVSFKYSSRLALDKVDFEVMRGELFGLLGPNGSGKSTLLRILSCLLFPSEGQAKIDGLDIKKNSAEVRHRLGVAFQSPSLDGKLSIQENLKFQGYMFGMTGRSLAKRIDELLEPFGLADRRKERVEILSGGLKRRVELAKCLLQKPPLLLLDEPSTGLDPAARQDFWEILNNLRDQESLTVLVATHLMDEAEQCDRVALLDMGLLVALDKPETLKANLDKEMVTIETADPEIMVGNIQDKLGLQAVATGGEVRIETQEGLNVIKTLLQNFPDEIQAVKLGKPTLEDVFLTKTGHSFKGKEEWA